MRIGPQGEPQFWAATALDAVDDTTIDATIREGMTFHDGNPVTAEDVAFTFNYMKVHKAAYYNATLGQLESATAIGPDTVRFKLANPFAPWLAPYEPLERHYQEDGRMMRVLTPTGDFWLSTCV